MFNRFLARSIPPQASALACHNIPKDDRRVYAVADMHGCTDLLKRVEEAIAQDLQGAKGHVVFLGDLIDRGPDSAETLDHLLRAPPFGLMRHVLLGNHEIMFARFLDNPRQSQSWLQNGGIETLQSYGIDVHMFRALTDKKQRMILDAHIPASHRAFLAQLPAVLTWGEVVFAHSGIDFDRDLNDQREAAVLWRKAPVPPEAIPEGKLLIHGHFPINTAQIGGRVINLDIGAYLHNRAAILRIDPLGAMELIHV